MENQDHKAMAQSIIDEALAQHNREIRMRDHRAARFTGTKIKGKRVFNWRVTATVSDLSGSVCIVDADVLAHKASDAMWAIRDEAFGVMQALGLWQPIEIETRGPKGGKNHQFMGWDTLMMEALFGNRKAGGQPDLFE